MLWFQGAYLSGGDVVLPQYAAFKYGGIAKMLNWTILKEFWRKRDQNSPVSSHILILKEFKVANL